MRIKQPIMIEMERHYRLCACRSSTPFFSERRHKPEVSSNNELKEGVTYRTAYQHDRDKILYSKSFRRLRLKSQMFPEHTADHFRTRLDHSLEVAQISQHLARQLKLNEDLVDAMALAHDIGHAPFAHSGERALHEFCMKPITFDDGTSKPAIQGFKHNWQGLRVVDVLDLSYPEHDGLNLTRATRIGIVRHTGLRYRKAPDQECFCDLQGNASLLDREFGDRKIDQDAVLIFEAQVVAIADEIAQVIHDLEDAFASRMLSLELTIKSAARWPIIDLCVNRIQTRIGAHAEEWRSLANFNFADEFRRSLLMTRMRSEIIFILTRDIITASAPKLRSLGKRGT